MTGLQMGGVRSEKTFHWPFWRTRIKDICCHLIWRTCWTGVIQTVKKGLTWFEFVDELFPLLFWSFVLMRLHLGPLCLTITRRMIYNKGPNNMAKEVFSALLLLAGTWFENYLTTLTCVRNVNQTRWQLHHTTWLIKVNYSRSRLQNSHIKPDKSHAFTVKHTAFSAVERSFLKCIIKMKFKTWLKRLRFKSGVGFPSPCVPAKPNVGLGCVTCCTSLSEIDADI